VPYDSPTTITRGQSGPIGGAMGAAGYA
jgi:hypothetical protein